MQKFAESEHIANSMLLRWLKDKDNIYRKCYESYDNAQWKKLDLDR